MKTHRRFAFLRGVIAGVIGLTSVTALRAADPAPLAEYTYSGDQAALVGFDREIREAGRDAGKLAALEKRLLEQLKRREATFAGRQAIAQRLGLVLAASTPVGAETLKPFATMLVDERDSDLARLALDRVPGDGVDTVFLNALGKSTGRARLGVINTLGRRHVEKAVAPLTKLLPATDLATAHAAARALGEIGGAAALAALRPLEWAAGARLAATTRLPAADAVRALRELIQDARAPAAVRNAALRTLLERDPAGAAQRISETLAGSDWPRKAVAVEAIVTSTAPDLVSTLTGKLAGWDAATQTAVLAALGRRGDPAAVAAVSTALTHGDAGVRSAAIGAIGRLPGTPQLAAALAPIAAGDRADEAKLARQSLARLNGPGVSDAILRGARGGATALRCVYLEQLAARNLSEGLPMLYAARSDPEPAVRSAAMGALGEIAPPADLPKLIDWAIAATDDTEQTRALRAVVNATLRDPAPATRGAPVYSAIEHAEPAVALRLLPALPRIGGQPSADCAARLALGRDARVADAAVAALARWSDATALDPLVSIAAKSPAPAVRQAALEAAAKNLEQNRDAWTAQGTARVKTLFASTDDSAARKRLLALLNRAKDDAARDFAASLTADAALGADARYTSSVITANRAGRPIIRASHNPTNVGNMIDGKTSTRWNTNVTGEEWIEVDFKASRPLRKITLDQTGRATDFPERYEVFVTDDLARPGNALASGKGQRNRTVITLPADTTGRYVVIKNTQERDDGTWAICELVVE